MTGERPSPERRLIQELSEWAQHMRRINKPNADLLERAVAALAAETARADANESLLGVAARDRDAAQDKLPALAARLKQARAGVRDVRDELVFRASQVNEAGQAEPRYTAVSLLSMAKVLDAALAALQEAPPNGEAT